MSAKKRLFWFRVRSYAALVGIPAISLWLFFAPPVQWMGALSLIGVPATLGAFYNLAMMEDHYIAMAHVEANPPDASTDTPLSE